MIKISTPNDVIAYLYNDLESTIVKQQTQQSIMEEQYFTDLYYDCLIVKEKLQDNLLSPSESTLQNILAYSRKSCKQAIL